MDDDNNVIEVSDIEFRDWCPTGLLKEISETTASEGPTPGD